MFKVGFHERQMIDHPKEFTILGELHGNGFSQGLGRGSDLA